MYVNCRIIRDTVLNVASLRAVRWLNWAATCQWNTRETVRLFAVIKEKLFVTGSHHLYVILAGALSAPVIIAVFIITLALLHRRRWLSWRKRSLAMDKFSPVPVHCQQSLTSQAPALAQQLQPADIRWEINPAM